MTQPDPTQTAQLNTVDLTVREATDAVASALITYVTEDDIILGEFFEWFVMQTGDETMSREQMSHDLNAVREALENMGIHFP